MKFVLISDTHFGDPEGTLIVRKGRGAGTGNDYLILLGDVPDFAMECYDEA